MTTNQFLDLVYNLFFCVILIPITVGITTWKKLTSADHYLIALLAILFFLEAMSVILGINRIRNHFIYYFRTYSELWFITLFYIKSVGWKKWPIGIAIAMSIVIPIEVFCWVGFNYINSATLTFSRFIIAVYAFIYLKNRFESFDELSLRKSLNFYHYIGLFIYGFFSAATVYMKNYFIETSLDMYYFFDTLGVIAMSVSFILFTLGLLQNLKTLPNHLR